MGEVFSAFDLFNKMSLLLGIKLKILESLEFKALYEQCILVFNCPQKDVFLWPFLRMFLFTEK